MTFDGYIHALELLIIFTIGGVVTFVARAGRKRP